MADAEQRRRERGDDPAAWLRSQLRTGELSEERLRLAAWLGDEPALDALGSTPSGPPRPPRFQAWAQRMGDRIAAFVDPDAPSLAETDCIDWLISLRHFGPEVVDAIARCLIYLCSDNWEALRETRDAALAPRDDDDDDDDNVALHLLSLGALSIAEPARVRRALEEGLLRWSLGGKARVQPLPRVKVDAEPPPFVKLIHLTLRDSFTGRGAESVTFASCGALSYALDGVSHELYALPPSLGPDTLAWIRFWAGVEPFATPSEACFQAEVEGQQLSLRAEFGLDSTTLCLVQDD
jgi:hypothetical protein